VHPVLFELGPLSVRSYAAFLTLACVVAWRIRRKEIQRLGHDAVPGMPWVLVGALMGAIVGAKLGMLMFEPTLRLERILSLDFTGKTVVGGLIGGYIGVEVSKKMVGITRSTGDAFAVALPTAQAIGRVGCLLHGCCYGTPMTAPWAVHIAGRDCHPTQIYEATLLLVLARWLWSIRGQPRPAGHLFRRYLVGYGLIRFGLEFVRGDAALYSGPLSIVQWVCLAAVVVFGGLILRGERRS
jgi:prolipoprotein diacylglyceryltransferase